MSTQFNPYAAAQNPYGPPQQSGFPPQPSPYGGGFPPQMPPDAFGPGMGAPTGPGGGLRPYESGGFADDSNGDLGGGSEGGLLSKIFSIKGGIITVIIGAAAYAAKRYFFPNEAAATDENGSTPPPEESSTLKANTELSNAFDSLETEEDHTAAYKKIENQLDALNKIELPDAPEDDSPDSFKAQRKALTELNAAYGYDPEADSYNAAEALKSPKTSEIKKAHAQFATAFKDFKPPAAKSGDESDDAHTHAH